MTARPMNMPLYHALLKAGTSEAEAEAAAQVDTADLVTKADLTAALHELRADVLKWTVALLFTALGIQTGLLVFVFTHYRP